ncbi:MAG: hypothetical protein ABWZ54_02095 [Luteibacter sp.]
MGNVIDFLARLGGDASLRHASDETLAAMAGESGLDGALGAAMLARDPDALRTLMGHGIFFSTQMGDPQREEKDPLDDKEDDDDDDDEDDNPLSHHDPVPPPRGRH